MRKRLLMALFCAAMMLPAAAQWTPGDNNLVPIANDTTLEYNRPVVIRKADGSTLLAYRTYGYHINPETGEYLFPTFFDAFYWASCTLTTVGYGDIYPISTTGRAISIISSVVGIAIIALPSGIITAGYMEEVRKHKNIETNEKNDEKV